jgi:tetratricopeptide (TPR) repeat protein
VWVKAVAYGRQAGTKAAQRSAYREAVTRFEQALMALQHLPESRDKLEQAIDLRLELRNVLHPLGAVERMLEVMREATTLADTLDDPRRLGWTVSRTALAYWQRGDLDHALESAHRALSMGVALDDAPLQASAYWSLGVAYQAFGAYAEGIDCLTRNLGLLTGELSQASLDMRITSPLAVTSRAQLARCLAEVGAFTEGITHGQEAVRLAEALKRPYDRVSASLGIGHLYLRKGDLDKAIAVLEESLELCRGRDVLLLFPWVGSALGGAYAMGGRVAEGLPLLEQAVEQAAAMRFMVHHASRVAMLSEGVLKAGRRADAAALATHALALAREYKERGNYAWAVRLQGELAAHDDAPAEADAHYRAALALATELGMRPLQAHCHLGLGKLYIRIGRRAEARAELDTAIKLYRAMDMTFWLPQAEAMLARAA